MLKKFYPYTLANNTSSMGVNAQVLRNISNKFLLAYDNDQSGQEGIERDKNTLRNLGAYVESLQLHDGYKDCADYLEHPDKFEELKVQNAAIAFRLTEMKKQGGIAQNATATMPEVKEEPKEKFDDFN